MTGDFTDLVLGDLVDFDFIEAVFGDFTEDIVGDLIVGGG